MDLEKPRDFGSLRAMFQNDSNFSNMLLESAKKPTTKFSPRQNTGGSSVSHPMPKPLHQRQVPDPEQQTKQFSYTSQKLELRQVKPMIFPKVNLKDRKDPNLSGAICKPPSLEEELQKPHPRSQGSEGASSSFRNTLHIWENASAQGDRKCGATPPQYTIRTTSLSHPKVNVAISTEDKAKIAGFKQGVALDVCKPSSPVHNEFVPTTSPPVPPRSHASLNKVVAGFSPSSSNNLNSLSKVSNERCPDDEDTKLPKIKLLPSIKELGPPPKKPPRPPKVDLAAFQQNCPDNPDDAYLTPEITVLEDLNTYEETIYYQEQQENCPNFVQQPIHSFKFLKKEDTKICSPRSIFMKPKIRGNEKNMPQEKTNQCFSGEGLAKDGDFSDDYVCLESLRTDERKRNPDLRIATLEQAAEEVYDDVEGIERDLQSSDAHRSFVLHSNDTYEETYEDIQSDIQSEGYNSSKSDNLSHSVPNLVADVMAQENFVYNDIDPEQNDTRNPFKVKKYLVEKNNKMTKEEQSFRERFMYNKEITVINTAVAHCSNTSIRGNLDLRILPGEQLEVIDITEGNQLICRNSEGKYGYVLLEHLNFR
uniref:FYN-binding protein 2 n=1 Tax=Laticauda laticaudata TaxID=8630 RepID=A0A8C5RLK2_LATLA